MSEAEHDFALRLDARVDEIGERIAKIEGKIDSKDHKSFRQHVSETAGLLALFLSITVASFTVYNNFVLQPRKEIAQREINFRNDVNALADVVARVSGLDYAGNPQAAMAQAAIYTPQRIALRNKILASDSAMPGVLGFADRLLIVTELDYFGLVPDAINQVELALAAATNPTETANGHWSKARLSGRLNNLPVMRDAYALALDEFKSFGLYNSAGMVVQVYLQWIAMELVNGTCESASAAHAQLLADFNKPEVLQSTRDFTVAQFALMLSQSPKTCGLSLN